VGADFCGTGIRGAARSQYFGGKGVELGAIDRLAGLLFGLGGSAVHAVPSLPVQFILGRIGPFYAAGLGYRVGARAGNQVGLLRQRGAKH